MAPNPHSSNS
jgi:hypothetical protein